MKLACLSLVFAHSVVASRFGSMFGWGGAAEGDEIVVDGGDITISSIGSDDATVSTIDSDDAIISNIDSVEDEKDQSTISMDDVTEITTQIPPVNNQSFFSYLLSFVWSTASENEEMIVDTNESTNQAALMKELSQHESFSNLIASCNELDASPLQEKDSIIKKINQEIFQIKLNPVKLDDPKQKKKKKSSISPELKNAFERMFNSPVTVEQVEAFEKRRKDVDGSGST